MKIIDYCILSVGFEPDEELQKLVKEKLTAGWQPFGSPFITPETDRYYPLLCQAMVKYEAVAA